MALFDECPVMLSNVSAPGDRQLTVNPSEFRFIADAGHVTAVHAFLESLRRCLQAELASVAFGQRIARCMRHAAV
jgi:hypothetical protein